MLDDTAHATRMGRQRKGFGEGKFVPKFERCVGRIASVVR